MSINGRWMIRRDMPEVLDIEQLCFENSWDEEEFIRWLRSRSIIGWVAEQEKRILGFMVYELAKSSLRVVNFAVLPSQQRTGVGRFMIDKLKSKLSPQRRNKIIFPVREENVEAQLFARSIGFTCVNIDHAYFRDSEEAAYIFEYRYSPSNVALELQGERAAAD